jgi:hypothetical protein
MKFNCCKVDAEGWHYLYSCNYPVVFNYSYIQF